jgi:hypothetical protein
MAATYADELLVVHHNDDETRYEQVSYCPWPGGVTVYRDGEEIVIHDVLRTEVNRLAAA